MTKVAILLSGLRFGGAERVSLNLAKAFKEKGYQVDILVLKKTGELIESAENDFNLSITVLAEIGSEKNIYT